MSNEILDQVEENKRPRACPTCGEVYPFGKFVRRFVLSFGFLKWKCVGCGAVLKCDFVKLQFFWFIGLMVCLGLVALASTQFDFGNNSMLFLLPYFPFVLVTMYYVKFEKAIY